MLCLSIVNFPTGNSFHSEIRFFNSSYNLIPLLVNSHPSFVIVIKFKLTKIFNKVLTDPSPIPIILDNLSS